MTLPLVGRHNVANVLAALAAVLSTGASPSHALGGLDALSPAPGRLERVSAADRGISVFVDYAHTPDALEAALTALRELGSGAHAGRLICVFGCGGERDPGKRAPMGAVAGRLADLVVVTSDNPRGEDPSAIAAAVLEGLQGAPARVLVELDRRAAIAAALEAARPEDVVLVAGKGHESVQLVGDQQLAFDDCQVVRELLASAGPGG